MRMQRELLLSVALVIIAFVGCDDGSNASEPVQDDGAERPYHHSTTLWPPRPDEVRTVPAHASGVARLELDSRGGRFWQPHLELGEMTFQDMISVSKLGELTRKGHTCHSVFEGTPSLFYKPRRLKEMMDDAGWGRIRRVRLHRFGSDLDGIGPLKRLRVNFLYECPEWSVEFVAHDDAWRLEGVSWRRNFSTEAFMEAWSVDADGLCGAMLKREFGDVQGDTSCSDEERGVWPLGYDWPYLVSQREPEVKTWCGEDADGRRVQVRCVTVPQTHFEEPAFKVLMDYLLITDETFAGYQARNKVLEAIHERSRREHYRALQAVKEQKKRERMREQEE